MVSIDPCHATAAEVFVLDGAPRFPETPTDLHEDARA
jgi:hypothetical protein